MTFLRVAIPRISCTGFPCFVLRDILAMQCGHWFPGLSFSLQSYNRFRTWIPRVLRSSLRILGHRWAVAQRGSVLFPAVQGQWQDREENLRPECSAQGSCLSTFPPNGLATCWSKWEEWLFIKKSKDIHVSSQTLGSKLMRTGLEMLLYLKSPSGSRGWQSHSAESWRMGNCSLGPGQVFQGRPSIRDFLRTGEPMDRDSINLQGSVQGIHWLLCMSKFRLAA